MRILFLSHCAPNALDKGEKIRAHHTVLRLSQVHELHVVCLAREPGELVSLRKLEGRCASVYGEVLHPFVAMLKAAVPFVLGGCLNILFYRNNSIARYVREMAAQKPFDAAVVYSAAMAPYVPEKTPYLLDMQDVDSEKWFQYANRRFPGWLFRMEASRLRKKEIELAQSARRTFFVTEAEERLFLEFAGAVPTAFIENGWGIDGHDPDRVVSLPELSGRRLLVFVGSMDYYPNIEGAVWFARNIFPDLRRRDPSLEFFIVGRSPSRAVRSLGGLPGVTVTGTVPDPRPYLKVCIAAVAPLQLARGIQLKVIEALAMGKSVLASPAVAKTFGGQLPHGVTVCETGEDYWQGLLVPDRWDVRTMREAVRVRFDGYRNLERLEQEVASIGQQPVNFK